MASGIIIGGKVYDVGPICMPIPVLNWDDHGLQFVAGQGHNRTRTDAMTVRKIVWHWTGGEGPPERVHRTLSKRKLGVSFCVGRNAIYQFADPMDVVCAAAGSMKLKGGGRHSWNAESVSVEVVSYGYRRLSPMDWRRGNFLLIPKKGRGRETYKTIIHGVRRRVAMPTKFQMRMCKMLADALSLGLQVPRVVTPTKHRQVFPHAIQFSGHVGHLELTARKIDPGPGFLQELGSHFSNNPIPPPSAS